MSRLKKVLAAITILALLAFGVVAALRPASAPAWMILFPVGLAIVVWGIYRLAAGKVTRQRLEEERCPACGYILGRSDIGTCPECGMDLEAQSSAVGHTVRRAA